MPMSFEEEELLRLLSGQPKPAPLPPPPDYEYEQRANKFLGEAEDLERQAATPVARPKGFKEHFVSGARAFMEGMAQPSQPFAGAQRREAIHASEMQELAKRAGQLRNASATQQQMGETARLRRVQENREAREATQQEFENKKPVITHMGQGTIAQTPQIGGKSTFEHDPSWESATSKNQPVTGLQRDYAVRNDDPNNTPIPVVHDVRGIWGLPGKVYDVSGNEPIEVTGQVTKVDPVQLQTWDPDRQAPVLTPRAQIRGGGAIAAPSAATLKENRETLTGVADLEKLGELYRPDFVGPAAGRWYSGLQLAPEAVEGVLPTSLQTPPGFTDFAAQNATVKNSIMRLTSGAQITPSEEKRLLAQLPGQNDRGSAWESKYQMALRRAKVLQYMIENNLNGAGMKLEDIDKLADIQASAKMKGMAGRTPPATPGGDPEAPAQPQRPAVDLSQWKVRKVN